MKNIAILSLILLMSGCSTLAGKLDNRVSCTLAGDKMLYSSMYGPIGITSEVAAADAKLCAVK